MKRKAGIWLIGWLLLICAALGLVAVKTVQVDPFFHFHKPNTAGYYYPLDNERSQNDGIVKHFDYTGLIAGTSMTENFKTSEAEELWGGVFVKVPFSGGTFREINDNIDMALRYNPKLKVVVRGLDMMKLTDDKDEIRLDLGEYPTYLYDDNAFNDVRYIFNRDVVFSRVYTMTKENGEPGFTPGITSFDRYANWMGRYTFGKDTLFPDGVGDFRPGEPVHLTEAQAEQTRENILQNVVATAREHPDVTFYYFIPPYSAQWWMEQLKAGTVYKQVEAERIAIEEILPCENIRLYSFNCLYELTTDLNHYKDHLHYGDWVNSMMLRWMHEDLYRLTTDNYEDYLEEELRFYTTYDYMQLNEQPDYEDDSRAAMLLDLPQPSGK